MAQTYAPEKLRAGAFAPSLKSGVGVGVLAFLFVAVCSLVALYQQSPPSPVAANATASEFSSGRAMQHLRVIGQRPHPMGTLEHTAVRRFLVEQLNALGLETEVQATSVLSHKQGNALRAASVSNVVARLRGSGDGQAVMLSAHYDTVPNSPGASDDGAGVATLLETARALKTAAPLKNDVIFLFSDGEESGLFGAKAFVEQHPLARQVALALNFEARGASGPAVLFETSEGNGGLIREFAAAAPHPNANSLSYEIYRRMPNSTDMNVFREARMSGLNFAYFDGFTRYHAQSDNLENIDEASLQHQGVYALALARRFGNASLGAPREANAVYFDLLGISLIHYSTVWVLPATALLAVLFAAVVWLGLKRRRITPRGIVYGFVAFVAGTVTAAAAAMLVWWLIGVAQGVFGREVQDDLYQSRIYLGAFVLLGIAVAAALYKRFFQKVGVENLSTGALLCWLILLVAASLLMPGASYLLFWPLLFSLAARALAFAAKSPHEGDSIKTLAIQSLFAVPGIILLVPMVYQVFAALGFLAVGIVLVMVMLLFGLLIPHFRMMMSSRNWLLPGGAALAAIALLLFAGLTAGFDRQHPKSNSISYIFNADMNQAVWASTDPQVDEWTRQFFSTNVERGGLNDYVPTSFNGFLKSSAPVAAGLWPAPLELVEDRTHDGIRTLRMRINSAAQNLNITVPARSNPQLLATEVNGNRVDNTGSVVPAQAMSAWSLQYVAPPAEGVELAFDVQAGTGLSLRVVEVSYGLPQVAGMTIKPRPDDMMPASQSSPSDTTQISKTYTF